MADSPAVTSSSMTSTSADPAFIEKCRAAGQAAKDVVKSRMKEQNSLGKWEKFGIDDHPAIREAKAEFEKVLMKGHCVLCDTTRHDTTRG